MEIRQTNPEDAEAIHGVYYAAFDSAEATMVAELAVKLLNEKTPVSTLSLVVTEHDEIVGHVAFSPVLLKNSGEHIGYILAPLAVEPRSHKQGLGSALVKQGLELLSEKGSFVVFVYGDPQYYSRFGFELDPAKSFIPAYDLEFPLGWQATMLNGSPFPEGGEIACVGSLNAPELW